MFVLSYFVLKCVYVASQGKVTQLLLHKGLETLSAKEVEDLLTRLELQRFVPKFNEINVGLSYGYPVQV